MAIAGQKVTRDFLELDPWHKFYLGLNYYYLHPYRRNAPEERVIWQKGSTRLLQIGGESHKNTLLMIPSLINKSYIFDLKENYSLARYLAKNSNILIMDWGDLTEEELAFDFSDYVTKRILPAIEFISHNHSNISLLGYCLGGIMAMAACFFAKNISSLILIATPWDFSSFKILDYPMDSSLSICSYAINNWFVKNNFDKIFNKFANFASMDQKSAKAEHFVAIEQWVRDGINVAKPVMDQLIYEFIEKQTTINNGWIINDTIIDPKKLNIPSVIFIPTQDQIAPISSTKILEEQIRNSQSHYIDSGHIGMVIGSKSKSLLWQVIAEYLLVVSQAPDFD